MAGTWDWLDELLKKFGEVDLDEVIAMYDSEREDGDDSWDTIAEAIDAGTYDHTQFIKFYDCVEEYVKQLQR